MTSCISSETFLDNSFNANLEAYRSLSCWLRFFVIRVLLSIVEMQHGNFA